MHPRVVHVQALRTARVSTNPAWQLLRSKEEPRKLIGRRYHRDDVDDGDGVEERHVHDGARRPPSAHELRGRKVGSAVGRHHVDDLAAVRAQLGVSCRPFVLGGEPAEDSAQVACSRRRAARLPLLRWESKGSCGSEHGRSRHNSDARLARVVEAHPKPPRLHGKGGQYDTRPVCAPDGLSRR
jgi:hypothetical protein